MPTIVKNKNLKSYCETVNLTEINLFSYSGSGQAEIMLDGVIVEVLNPQNTTYTSSVAGDYKVCITGKTCSIGTVNINEVLGGSDVSVMTADIPNRLMTHTAGGVTTQFLTGLDLADSVQVSDIISALSLSPDVITINDAFGNPLYKALPI